MPETEFEIFYNGEKKTIMAGDLYSAKKMAVILFRVPKSKHGLIAIQSIQSKENQDFRFL